LRRRADEWGLNMVDETGALRILRAQPRIELSGEGRLTNLRMPDRTRLSV